MKVRQIEFTWWAEDGSECRGRVSLAPDASPETTAALVRMMRLADSAASGAGIEFQALCWLEEAREALDEPQEERYRDQA